MAKSQETFNKKEKEKQKEKKRKEKEERKAERKAHSKESKSFEDMLAYVDEFGNITSSPPDTSKKQAINQDEILIGARKRDEEEVSNIRKGKVTFFNTSKGFGFIKDEVSQESVFVHVHALTTPIQENDRVTFETQRGPKGLSAVNVKKA
jgi:cold shock CspA family protein